MPKKKKEKLCLFDYSAFVLIIQGGTRESQRVSVSNTEDPYEDPK